MMGTPAAIRLILRSGSRTGFRGSATSRGGDGRRASDIVVVGAMGSQWDMTP